MARKHAFGRFRAKLEHESLTLEDWVLAERDLVENLEPDGLLNRWRPYYFTPLSSATP
jgi:hypothetical protein